MSATFSPAIYRKGSPLSEEQKAIARAIDEATADLAALRAAVPALMRIVLIRLSLMRLSSGFPRQDAEHSAREAIVPWQSSRLCRG